MRTKRLSLMILCAMTAAAALAGCHAKAEAEKQDVQIEAQKEKVKLTFFSSEGSNEWLNTYKKILLEYNQVHTDVEVGYDGISVADGYNEYLLERLDSGQGDDVFEVNADMVKTLHSRGYFYDLSGIPAFSMLNDAAKAQSMIGGVAYAVPLNMTAYGMCVNTDLLAQFGLKPPENYDEWMHCCKVLKENGVTPFSLNRWYALTVPVMARGLYPIYQSEEKEEIIKGLNSGEVKIGDYMLPGFEMFEEFIKNGYYGDVPDGAAANAIKAGTSDFQDFAEGKTAFLFWAATTKGPIAQLNPDMDYILQGIPALPDGTVSLPSVASRICVNADGAHIDEAVEFVTYITSEKVKRILNGGEVALPTLKDADFKLPNEKMRKLYETAMLPGQIPIEDMELNFTYWDTTRELCIAMFDGMTAKEAAEEYNRIQMEQIRTLEGQ